MSIKRHLSSSGFRIVGLYVLFYLITAVGFLWLMFSVLGAEIENTIKAEIEREHALMIEQFGQDQNTLTERIGVLIGKADPLKQIYILKEGTGEIAHSNYPYKTDLEPGWQHILELDDEDEPYEDDDADESWFSDLDILPSNAHDEGYVGWVAQHNGQTLFIGRTLDRIDETKDIFVRIAFVVFPLSLFLAVLGGMLFNRLTTRRIEVINEQCRTIRRRGDLSLRVPNKKPGDEYGLLIANINAMLDNIDKGVRNVQEVSDDVAHDLRTPLTRIKYGLEGGLLDKTATKSDLRNVMESSLGETDSLLETFSAILRISQMNTGLRKSKFQVFDITALAETVVEAYEPITEEKGHSIALTRDAHACHVNGDKDMLGQLLSNLIENTFQHAGENLSIAVTVTCNPEQVIVSVQDNGTGISDEEREKIFNKFYRVDKSRSESGSGLGLAIVKAVAGLHNGNIQVENCDPGCKFSISFPRDLNGG